MTNDPNNVPPGIDYDDLLAEIAQEATGIDDDNNYWTRP